MDTIYRIVPDLIFWGVALALYYCLAALRPKGSLSFVLAILSGCVVVAIMLTLLLADDLPGYRVYELAMIGMGLTFGLLQWNRNRLRSKAHNGQTT